MEEDQLSLDLSPHHSFLVGIRTESGEIQHYTIEALCHNQARQLVSEAVPEARTAIVRIK